MGTDFYFLQRCAYLQFHKFESLISFHVQADYGSDLGEYYHNTICKQDIMHISQESYHTTGLLELYLYNITLCRLNQCAYQISTMIFTEIYRKLYYARCDISILDPPSHSHVSFYKYKIIFKEFNRQKTRLFSLYY